MTQFFPPDYAATGQLIEELVQHLDHQNWAIDVFTGQPGYAFQTPSAASRERLGKATVRRSQIARLWPRRIRGKAINGVLFTLRAALHLVQGRRQRDVLLVTTAPPFLPILGYVAHVLFGTPYVCLLYDLYPDIANTLGVIHPNHWLSRFWNRINQRIWHKAQGIIVLSSSMKERIVEKCPAIASKVHIIHNWADPDQIRPLEKHRNWFAWKHNLVETFTVLYSGNLGRCHDVDTLLETARQLKDDPVQFVIIGNGANHQILQERVQQHQLNHVQFLPYQDRADLPYSLTACDLALVSVAPGMEGLVAPSKLYSALAAGRPIGVICEDQSYLSDVIEQAGCGQTVRNGEADKLAHFIRTLAANRDLGQRMGTAGRAFMERHFTPQHIAHQYAQVLLGQRAESRARFQNIARTQRRALRSEAWHPSDPS